MSGTPTTSTPEHRDLAALFDHLESARRLAVGMIQGGYAPLLAVAILDMLEPGQATADDPADDDVEAAGTTNAELCGMLTGLIERVRAIEQQRNARVAQVSRQVSDRIEQIATRQSDLSGLLGQTRAMHADCIQRLASIEPRTKDLSQSVGENQRAIREQRLAFDSLRGYVQELAESVEYITARIDRHDEHQGINTHDQRLPANQAYHGTLPGEPHADPQEAPPADA